MGEGLGALGGRLCTRGEGGSAGNRTWGGSGWAPREGASGPVTRLAFLLPQASSQFPDSRTTPRLEVDVV